LLNNCEPGRVQLRRRRGRPAAGHPVGLLDQRDAAAGPLGRPSRRAQIRRLDSAARTVTQDEHTGRIVGELEMDSGWAVGSFELEH
jgi:hypothetical protein